MAQKRCPECDEWCHESCKTCPNCGYDFSYGSGGCYLTTACCSVMKDKFDDNCYELTELRNFRDTYLKKYHPSEIEEYYNTAPRIVENINSHENSKDIYMLMYDELVLKSLKYIEEKKLERAYLHYKNYTKELTKKFF